MIGTQSKGAMQMGFFSIFKSKSDTPPEPVAPPKRRDPRDKTRSIEWPEAHSYSPATDHNGMSLFAVRLATGYLRSSKEYRRVYFYSYCSEGAVEKALRAYPGYRWLAVEDANYRHRLHDQKNW